MSASAALGQSSGAQPRAEADQPNVCRDVSSGAKPLLVDWKSEERADLEVAMSQGIAVMAYDCDRLRLLSDCVVEGSYGYKGVVFKQQLIRLKSEDEIKANLPLNGGALVAQLEGELERGATLDLATALVGNYTGSRLSVLQGQLKGRCEGATHFVRSANVGAFVLQSGESARVMTAAQVFQAGAHAQSESSRFSRVSDGLLEGCKTSSSDADKPPRNCGALYRVRLLPITEQEKLTARLESTDKKKTSDAAEPSDTPEPAPAVLDDSACPEGMVFREGKCAEPQKAVAHECDPHQRDDCRAQCKLGDTVSCTRWARLILGDEDPDFTQAARLLENACKEQEASACSDLGVLTLRGQGLAKSPEHGLGLFLAACRLGEENGCFNAANLYYAGRGTSKNKERAFALYEQACQAGKPEGCVNVANMYDDGEGVEADPKKAFSLFKRACEGDVAAGCANLAYMHGAGKGTGEDEEKALQLYERSCALSSAQGCYYAAKRLLKGDGVTPNAARGRSLLERACSLGSERACATVPSSSKGGPGDSPEETSP